LVFPAKVHVHTKPKEVFFHNGESSESIVIEDEASDIRIAARVCPTIGERSFMKGTDEVQLSNVWCRRPLLPPQCVSGHVISSISKSSDREFRALILTTTNVMTRNRVENGGDVTEQGRRAKGEGDSLMEFCTKSSEFL
jgi:hypothetical protein